MAAKKSTTADTTPAEQSAKPSSSAEDTSTVTPGIDPTLSADNANSTYTVVNDQFPPDTGNQVEETPGKPKAVKD